MHWSRTGIEGDALAAARSASGYLGEIDVEFGVLPVLVRCPDCRGQLRNVRRLTKPNKWGVRNRLTSVKVCHRCGAVLHPYID